MSKTLEKPRKSFSKRWEPAQKEQVPFPPQVGEMVLGGPSVFGQTMEAAFYRPLFGLLRFTADAYNRPNFGQLPCEPSVGFHTEICRLHDIPTPSG